MLRLEHYERIRRMVLVEGLSRREVARRLGHSRNTVKKALEHSTPPPYELGHAKPRPVLGAYTHLIEGWLEEDQKRPRKQRQIRIKKKKTQSK